VFYELCARERWRPSETWGEPWIDLLGVLRALVPADAAAGGNVIEEL